MNLVVFLVLYVLLLIYGSLLPFQSAHRSIAEALSFLNEPLPAAATAFANADFGMNVVLYAPLGAMMVLALLRSCRRPEGASWSAATRVLFLVLAAIAAATLSLAIETAQGFLVLRKASLQDVFANALGATLGAALAAIFAPRLDRGLAALRTGGETSWRPIAALAIAAYLMFSFYPMDFVGGMTAWQDKFAAGRNGVLLASAVCSSTASCVPGLVFEIGAAAMLAALVNLVYPLGPRFVRWVGAGALVGALIELVQSGLDSGIAQGASVATRASGFALAYWLVNHLQPEHLARARRHVRLAAIAMATIAVVAILSVNRIHIPWAVSAEPLATRLSVVEWLPFRYVFDVGESRAALSIAAQITAYALLGAALWLASFGWRWVTVATGAALAAVVALAVEGAKLFIDGRHPDPSDILLAPLACGAAIALLRHLGGPSAPMSSAMAGNAHPRPATLSADDSSGPPSALLGDSVTGYAATNAIGWPTRAMAIALLLAALANAFALPRFDLGVVLVVALAAALVAWRRDFWLIVLPLALPVFDLTHWTGRMFWTEFDSLCAAMLAVLWWCNGLTAGLRLPQLPGWPALFGLGLWMLGGAIVAGWPLPVPVRGNLDSYFSPYVGFYALKGIGWALLFYPFAARALVARRERGTRWFAYGMVAGLAATTLFIIWERVTFPGLFNLAHEYRVTGPFSVMHVGGAYIEGYLIGALPFAAFCIVLHGADLRGAAAAALLAGSTFALLITHSREAYLALMVAAFAFVLPLLFAGPGGRGPRWRQIVATLLVTSTVAGGVLTLGTGRTIQQRFSTIATDADVRLDHWARSLRMLGSNPLHWVAGIGAGHFAAEYYWQPDAKDVPGRIVFATDASGPFARMGTGASIHLSQAVAVVANARYVVSVRLRSSEAGAQFTIPVCEKWLLDSFGCVRHTFTINGPVGQWSTMRWEFDTRELRYAVPWLGRPVKLSLLNPNAKAFVDVAAVSLRDAQGVELLRNGDFGAGTDNWVPTTDSHLAWHAKSLPLHVLVELGLVGLALFVLLVARTVIVTLREAFSGDRFAAAILAALAGMLTVGLTDSLIDAPRIATLFFLLVEAGLLVGSGTKPAHHPR